MQRLLAVWFLLLAFVLQTSLLMPDGATAFWHGNQFISVSFGSLFNYNTANYPTHYIESDTFATTWADDGNIYVTNDDSKGWQGATSSNFQVSQLSGFTTSLIGSNVNAMSAFGTFTQAGSDGFNYKAYGLSSINGCLYSAVSRTNYASSPTWKQTQQNAQIIKSCDHGSTWTPQPPSTAQPYASPMFPGANFGAPSFIQYGQDYQGNTVDNSGTYVYATSPDGYWQNASNIYLGRVKISDIASLDATKWSWWTGGDGMLDANWSSSLASAVPILSNSGKLSVGSPQYIPAYHQYMMICSYYPSVNNSTPSNDTTISVWLTYISQHPWGPFTLLQTNTWNPQGLYTPKIMPKSLSVDGGRTLSVITAGDYNSQSPSGGQYTLQLLPSTIP